MALASVQIVNPAGELSLCSPAAAARLSEQGWTIVDTTTEVTEEAAEKPSKKPSGKKPAAKKDEPPADPDPSDTTTEVTE